MTDADTEARGLKERLLSPTSPLTCLDTDQWTTAATVLDLIEPAIAAALRARETQTVEALTLAKESLDFYWPVDEHGEVTSTPGYEEPYWGARADKLRRALAPLTPGGERTPHES